MNRRRSERLERLRRGTYPEIAAGGYSRADGTVDFFARVNALLRPDMVVVDFGAGRGEWMADGSAYRRDLRMLRGKVVRVVGVDIDPVVLTNPSLDEAVVVQRGGTIPLEIASVDLIVADHTFEHIDEPVAIASELEKILRPGGWICARTPNRWGYIALGARLVPNRLHRLVLRALQPQRLAEDVFPTRYLMNTEPDLVKCFPKERFRHFSYTHTSEPTYFGSSRPVWMAVRALSRITPRSLGATRMIFIQKTVE